MGHAERATTRRARASWQQRWFCQALALVSAYDELLASSGAIVGQARNDGAARGVAALALRVKTSGYGTIESRKWCAIAPS